MVRLTSLSAAIAALPFILAHPADLYGRDDGRGECGTVTTAEDLANIAAVANLGSSSSVSVNGFSTSSVTSFAAIEPWPLGDIIVKTWMHVVAMNTTVEGGYIPDDQLDAQFAVLNENFGELRIIVMCPGHVNSQLIWSKSS